VRASAEACRLPEVTERRGGEEWGALGAGVAEGSRAMMEGSTMGEPGGAARMRIPFSQGSRWRVPQGKSSTAGEAYDASPTSIMPEEPAELEGMRWRRSRSRRRIGDDMEVAE